MASKATSADVDTIMKLVTDGDGVLATGIDNTIREGLPPFAKLCMQLLLWVPTMLAVALERTAWQQPVSAGAISDRGKQAVGAPALHLTCLCGGQLATAHLLCFDKPAVRFSGLCNDGLALLLFLLLPVAQPGGSLCSARACLISLPQCQAGRWYSSSTQQVVLIPAVCHWHLQQS